MKKLELIHSLKEFNGVILGQSAGAMNMSKYIITTPCNKKYNTFNIKEGLNLCNISVFPHCNINTDIFPKYLTHEERTTKKDDLISVANNYSDFYLIQDNKEDISYIRVTNNNIEFIKDNNARI